MMAPNLRTKLDMTVFITLIVSLGLPLWLMSNHDKRSLTLKGVQALIDAAQPGDTVVLPAGTVTWDYKLIIRKGIILKGAGVDKTVIVNNYGGSSNDYDPCMVLYRPDDFEANQPLRITGITFNLNNKGDGIILSHSGSSLTIQTKIRIDHNKFQNSATLSHQAIINNGMRGVVDSNIFTSIAYPIRHESCYGYGNHWWDNWEGVVYGKEDNNMYYEDNYFDGVTILMDSQYANRYALRYNTIHVTKDAYPFLDSHGNQGKGYMYSSFGGEIYGNLIYGPNNFTCDLLDHRGGKFLVFMNTVVASGRVDVWLQVRDEYPDYLNPTTNPQPQFINDSYYFLNRINYTGVNAVALEGQHSDNPPDHYNCPTADRDYFNGRDDFDGSSGCGYGPLSFRPSPGRAGVGYWATDQSTVNLKGMVGQNPATQISGTLYKCTSLGVWTAYYEPYTYPHPLRTILGD